ncbi:MAG TPA: plastocyanin/azurin family copper-binding protein [Acidimicrobiales bacterium]
MRTKNVIGKNVVGSVILALVGVVAAFTGACAGGDGGGGDGTSTSDAKAGDATVVAIEDFTFAPAEIEVKAGTTVRWENADAFLHTVTSGATSGPENEPDGRFDEELADAGSSAEVTFEEPGTYTYYCRQHNAMDGTITVA